MLRTNVFGWAGAILLTAACARMPSVSIPNPIDTFAGQSTVHVDVPVKPGAIPILRAGQALSLSVADFSDGRKGNPGRKVGDIKATVSNMHTTVLTLDQDVPGLVVGAARSQLAADGFRLAKPDETADFKISGVVKTFVLDIAGGDELNIVVEATLSEGRTGDVIWTGVITQKEDRYAGVSGNSRESIVEYLGDGLSEFAGKLSAATRDSLTKSYPQTLTVSQVKNVSAIPGVTTLHTPVSREKPLAQPAIPPREEAWRTAPVEGTGGGYVSVTSSPSRAKVYVDDVYFGMAPLKLELPVGVSLLRFKLDGYKVVTEKVSVRRGETTELEIGFQK